MKRTILLMLAAVSLASASTTTITIVQATDIGNAVAIRSNWVTSNFGAGYTLDVTETFESFGYGPYTSLNTGVGTFSIPAGSQAGTAGGSAGTLGLEFTVLNSSNSPFHGRFNTTPGGNNWLDSNDISKLQLTTSLSSLYFFMSDVNDNGGTLQVTTAGGVTSSSFGATGADGNLYFVGITSSDALGTVQWINNTNADGFAIDDLGRVLDTEIHAPAVPEPGSWPFAAACLIAIPLIRKWKSRKSDSQAPVTSETTA
jgi:hypothetical protein